MKMKRTVAGLLVLMLVMALMPIGIAYADTSLSATISSYAVTNTNFTVYSSRSTSSRKVGTAYGSEDLIKITRLYPNGWARISYPTARGTKSGYCKTRYMLTENVFSTKRYTAKSSMTVYRKSDCRDYFGKIYAGDRCMIIGDDGDSTQIVYPAGSGYKMGWVDGVYEGRNGVLVRCDAPVIDNPDGSMLNVPYYAQTDDRWSNVYIGTKTIGRIGCTTTCMAMLHSYYKGEEWTPKDMRSILAYSNNDILWSSVTKLGYTYESMSRKTISQADMRKIYDLLLSGKPVILGATTYSSSTSSQHYVVIKGYTGNGASFQAMDFIINDPMHAERTTLQEFLATKPYVYKMIY